ncbi:MAG: hypothetical protein PVJ53_04190 [Desulfobacterales bacterium]|jgi:rubrerythrin
MAKWQCSVCGYDHEGRAAPEQCPLCGAPQNRFSSDRPTREEKDQPPSTSPETKGAPSKRWQCGVCGYIHTGPEPPDQCPVCGVDRTHFSEIDPAPTADGPPQAAAPAQADDLRWQCIICGYIHTGAEPPERCPVCGADRSKFILLEESEAVDKGAREELSEVPPEKAAQEPVPPKRLDPYRHWINLAIEYHAHPIAVHIPNGVLPITVVMVLLAAIFDWPAIGQAGVFNMAFTALSMPVVLFSGYLHWQYKFGGHLTNLFRWKIICGGMVAALSGVLFLWGWMAPATARDPGLFYLVLHLVDLAFAGIAGWLGGKLVFKPGG